MVMISVLYVDDEPSLLDATKKFLEAKNELLVDTASNVPEALELLKIRKYDIIISDYQMPDIDGIEFLQMLRREKNTIPFIIFTGKGREEVVIEAYDAGADSYIAKGGAPKLLFMELARKIEQIVTRRRMEQDLLFSNTLLSTQQEVTLDGILVIDDDGKILSWNRRFMDMWPVSSGDLAEKSGERVLRSVLSHLHDPESFQEQVHYFRSHHHESGRDVLHLTDGRTLDCYSAPMVGSNKQYFGRIWYFRDISDQKKTEDALRKSAADLARAQRVANIGSWSYNPTTGDLHWSDQMYEIFTLPRTTSISMDQFLSIVHPDDRELTSSALRRALAGSLNFFDQEYRIVIKGGHIRKIYELAEISRSESGEPVLVFGTAEDVTERLFADETLTESERKYLKLIESANEGIFIIQDGVIPFVNPKALEIIGYSAEELATKNFLEHIHPDDRKETYDRHLRRLRGEPVEPVGNIRIIDKSGDTHWLEINAVMMSWNGKPATLNFGTDITQRKLAEEALRESEEKYRSVIENIQDVFYRTDNAGILVMASPSLARVLGYDSADECLGELLAEKLFYHPEQRAVFLQELLRKGSVIDYEVILRKKNGSPVYVATSSHFYYDKNGQVLGDEGVFRDISARKKAEEALVESLHEKELLLKEIHHRVKNNLQTIASLLYLQSLTTENEAQISLLREARSRVISMGLIHQKLYQSSDISHIPFTDYIQALIEFLEETYGIDPGKIRIVVDVNPPNLNLELDTGIPCGLIINELVTNAIKYAFRDHGTGEIRIHMEQTPEQYLLSVRDDGGGLPADLDLTNLKSLGLTIVSDLVSQLDGTLEIIRSPGTTFIIKFPI